MIIVKGGHVHGALTVLMFFSYAAFLAIAALINRDGTTAPRDHSPDAALSRGGRGFTTRPAVVYAGTRGRGRSPGRPCE